MVDTWLATHLLAGLAAASVQWRVALGGTPGGRRRRVGQTSVDRGVPVLGVCHARWKGFDLHAAVRVPAGQLVGHRTWQTRDARRKWHRLGYVLVRGAPSSSVPTRSRSR